jgi:RNA polymerase sigma-70 factor (ECF subfamily)
LGTTPRVRHRSRVRTAHTEADDEQLVEAALHGEREAFEVLVRRHRRGLVSHLYRQTGQRDCALDLAQEVFLKVYLSLASFDPRYRFTTWLYRIASNCAIDHQRKKHPRTCSLYADPRGDNGQGAARTLAGSDPTPDDMLRLRELQARLEESIRMLPVDYRQLILLRHRQHCRYDEIARITQLPIGTVKNRIFRAREMLRDSLHDVLSAEG